MAYYALRSNWHDNDERVTRRHRKTAIVTRSKSFHDLYIHVYLCYIVELLHRGYNIVRSGRKYVITDATCAIRSISIPFHDLRPQLSSCNCLLSSLARSISPPFIFSATNTAVYALSNSRRCVRSTLLLFFSLFSDSVLVGTSGISMRRCSICTGFARNDGCLSPWMQIWLREQCILHFER